MKTTTVCRVCGMEFTSPRCDAITCTDTCRQRLKRGQALAYLAALSKSEQHIWRRYHKTRDASLAAQKEWIAARRNYRDLKREQRQKQTDREQAMRELMREQERLVAEMVGRAVIAEMKQKRRRAALGHHCRCPKFFAEQHRNDMSAEAIAEFRDRPDDYPTCEIALALDQLRASGDYDRIVGEAVLPSGEQ